MQHPVLKVEEICRRLIQIWKGRGGYAEVDADLDRRGGYAEVDAQRWICKGGYVKVWMWKYGCGSKLLLSGKC
jgi:hypothetical protein